MPTLCNDIPPIKFSSRRTRIAKQEGERGLAAFNRWLKGQADGWCAEGLCSSGPCESRWNGTRARLLKETDEYIEVRFSVTISCHCAAQEPTETEPTAITPEPTGSGDGSGTAPPDGQGDCVCTKEEEEAELQRMLDLYKDAVNNARATGYQAGNDPNYSDPGLGLHKVGNCADWQQVSWAALVPHTWKCWRVKQIRARQAWTLFGFHHFVKIEAVCSGRVLYLDPWKSGKPDFWGPATFPCPDGNGWYHTETITHQAGAEPRDPGND